MSESVNTSTQKAKSLSVLIPTAAVLVLSAMLATPWLAAAPVYADGSNNDKCDKKYDDDKCKDKKKKKDNKKVTICHIPPGNPDNAHTIRVSENAVDAHLAHGDELGKCPVKDKDKR
jgi:hypothetical protein